MEAFYSLRFSRLFLGLLVLVFLTVPRTVQAQVNWRASVGAQSGDQGRQALAFLPNEIWIHTGDSITWTFESGEIHTVTFLQTGQAFPSFQVGCPGFASSTAIFNGSACLTTPPLVKGQTFTVTFTVAGSYKFECLVHLTMFGVVHVLNSPNPLPHNQDFYDDQAAAQRKALLSSAEQLMGMAHNDVHDGDDGSVTVFHKKHVIAGIGEVSSPPGGNQEATVLRFLNGTIEIHAGDTVEWSNHDPDEPHTITFGTEPPLDLQFPPSPNVTLDADGVGHAVVASTSDNVHSGFIEAILPDIPGLPSNPPSPTRFRVTFPNAGTFPYICVLHDNLGMIGKVVVLP